MKWIRFLFLLFLIPNLIYASSYYLTEYNKDVGKISSEWNQHNALIQQFNRLKLEEKERNIGLLREAIACCQRAIQPCDHILKKINEKSKDKRKKWENAKNQAQQDKNKLHTEIGNLQALINNTLQNIAFSKAIPLYQESEKKANLAILKNKDCARRLNNIEEVVSTLNDVCKFYEEALSVACEALHPISPYPDEASKNVVRKSIEAYQIAADEYKKESAEWPTTVLAQKAALKERLAVFKEEKRLFEEKGLKRSSYELQKQMLPVLEQLIESSLSDENETFKGEFSELKHSITTFETEADNSRLTESTYSLSQEEFRNQENKRREHFFKNDLLLHPKLFLPSVVKKEPRPWALPLDGHVVKNGKSFTLFTEQFYRFLVQSDFEVSQLLIKVYEKGEIAYEEKIVLPQKNEIAWEHYLTTDGMTFIPETKLKTEFGLDLRLHFVCDPMCNFSMIISQKGADSRYLFSISLDEGSTLY